MQFSKQFVSSFPVLGRFDKFLGRFLTFRGKAIALATAFFFGRVISYRLARVLSVRCLSDDADFLLRRECDFGAPAQLPNRSTSDN